MSYSNAEDPMEQPLDEYIPNFYVGHHEYRRPLPVTEFTLRLATDVGYDMVTCPVTTPHFQARVLTTISEHISALSSLESIQDIPAPIITPLGPIDTPLTPGSTISQTIAYTSPWIDLCSPDPLVANVSRQVLNMEIAYASFCGIGNVVIPGPRTYSSNSADSNGLAQYARTIQEILEIATYMQIAIHVPMYGNEEVKDLTGDLRELARNNTTREVEKDINIYETWDAWNMIRDLCKYNSRLSVALALPRQLPVESLQSRWFAEPLRILSLNSRTFLKNKGGHPVLSKAHQSLISRYMRLKNSPWLLLCEVGPIPGLSNPNEHISIADGYPSPGRVSDASPSPTPAEASSASTTSGKGKASTQKDPAAHLVYLRYLQRNQPPRTELEKFGSGYQDYLQAPLQPLTDNLESVTYEVFEKDPVKYDQYEKAIEAALVEWHSSGKETSGPNGAVVIAVTGSGRGPLVTRALQASQTTGVAVEMWAVEKNPNAYVLLQRHNEGKWNGVVNVVKSDMRAWKGPLLPNTTDSTTPRYGKVDIIVSELLGSFADNELSPECLDGVQHVLSASGISIPSSYTAHLSPIAAPRLHADISHRALTDPDAVNLPYVVMLHAIDFLATSVPGHPRIQQSWEFVHPLPSSTLATAEARRGGGVSGGGGGSMSGGDGANEHNVRYSRHKFVCRDRGVVNGLAGYFESVLYRGQDSVVELSTRPDTIDAKSKDMISWFPIYFPLKSPLYFPDDTELEVSIWRQTDDRKVWYEWLVESFVMVGPNKRLRLGASELGTSRKQGCLM